jgi:protein TonB
MRIGALLTLAALAPVAASSSIGAQTRVERDSAPPHLDTVYTGPPLPQSVEIPPGPPVVHARPRAPLASYASREDYPVAALRGGEQGRVAFALEIGPYGRVTSCTITVSSGSASLDDASCRIIRFRARYVPARDARGTPVSDHDRGELTWTLPVH